MHRTLRRADVDEIVADEYEDVLTGACCIQGDVTELSDRFPDGLNVRHVQQRDGWRVRRTVRVDPGNGVLGGCRPGERGSTPLACVWFAVIFVGGLGLPHSILRLALHQEPPHPSLKQLCLCLSVLKVTPYSAREPSCRRTPRNFEGTRRDLGRSVEPRAARISATGTIPQRLEMFIQSGYPLCEFVPNATFGVCPGPDNP